MPKFLAGLKAVETVVSLTGKRSIPNHSFGLFCQTDGSKKQQFQQLLFAFTEIDIVSG